MKMRIAVTLFVSLVIFVTSVVYTLNQPRIYEARGKVEFSAESESGGKKFSRRVPLLTSEEALDILDSASMVMGVTNRLNERDRERLSAPYADLEDEREITRSLYGPEVREFNSIADTSIIEVIYRHPDAEISALIVNAQMKELIDYSLKLAIDTTMKQVVDIRLRADREAEIIRKLSDQLAALETSAFEGSEIESEKIDEVREELEMRRELFDTIRAKMSEQKTVIHRGPGPIRIVDEAITPEHHVSPDYSLYFGLSALAGMICGALSFLLFGRFCRPKL